MDQADQKANMALLRQYLKNPLPGIFTVEIFEDLHAVIDAHVPWPARERGATESDDDVVESFEKSLETEIAARRKEMKRTTAHCRPTRSSLPR